jgi:hypothetical protein
LAYAGSSRLDEQALETPVVEGLSPSRCRRACEPDLRKPIQEFPYRDHRLETGKGSAEAEMGSPTKGKMPSFRRGSMEIELIGPLKFFGITMRCCNNRRYRFTLPNEDTA